MATSTEGTMSKDTIKRQTSHEFDIDATPGTYATVTEWSTGLYSVNLEMSGTLVRFGDVTRADLHLFADTLAGAFAD